MKLRQSWSLVSLFAILVAIGIVSAVVLIQQTNPSVPVGGSMSKGCDPSFPTPTNVTLGSSGQVTYSCSSSAPTTNPAFTTGGPVIVTPVVTGLNAPWNSTGLYIYTASGAVNTGTCSGRTGAVKVNNNSAVTLPQNAWNYCAKYETVGLLGLPQWSISWNL